MLTCYYQLLINPLYLPLAVPIVLVLIPLIVDLATGNDAARDIVVRRGNTTEDIS